MLRAKQIPLLLASVFGFLAITSLLVSSFTGQATSSSRLRWGADLFPLDSNYKHIATPMQCNGVWSCLQRLCLLESLSNVTYVALRDYYVDAHPNDSCSYGMIQSVGLNMRYSAFGACVSFLIISVVFEAMSVFGFFFVEKKLLSIINASLSLFFTTISWSCYGIYLLRYSRDSGDSEPKYMMIWQGFSVFLVWLTLVIVRFYFLYRYGTGKTPYDVM